MKSTATKARPPAKKDTVVNLRMPVATRDLIDNAAELAGKTRTAFIIESSRKEAVDLLLDQRLFTLTEEQYGAFTRALDAPPAANDRLKRLMASKSPWEK